MRRVLAGLLAGVLAVAWHSPAARAETPWPDEIQYSQIQEAFLGEQFAHVVELVEPHLGGEQAPTTLRIPGEAATARIWVWYALSLERLQRFADALQAIDRLKACLPKFSTGEPAPPGMVSASPADVLWPEILFWEGEISRKALQMVRAQLAYQRMLTHFPNASWRSQARLGLALILFHQQAYDAALQEVREVASTVKNPAIARQALLLEGLCYLQRKQFTDAVARFERLFADASDPFTQAQMTFYRGEALSGLHRFPEAEQAYQQAAEADPRSLWARLARFGIGWCQFQEQRCRESLETFGEKPDPAWPEAELLYAQGSCLIRLGDAQQAQARFERLRTDAPTHPLALEATMAVADLLQQQHRFDEASGLLESMLRESLGADYYRQAMLKLASLYLSQGKSAQAIAKFRVLQASEEPLIRQAALNGEGDVQLFLGQGPEAKRLYDDALAVSPGSPGGAYAIYQLSRLKLQDGRIDDAIEGFQRAAASGDASLAFDARLALAFAYLSKGKTALARQELEPLRVQAQEPAQAARAGYYLALVEVNDGHLDEARQLCEAVIRAAPESDEAFNAQLMLADLRGNDAPPEVSLSTLLGIFGDPRDGEPAASRRLTPQQRARLAKKLGDLARQAGVYHKAIAWYDEAAEGLPSEQGELDYLLASCYEEAGDVPVAIARYRAIAKGPWKIRGQLAAAKLFERDEQWPQAMEIYRTIMREPIPEAKIAEERLAVLRAQQAQPAPGIRAR